MKLEVLAAVVCSAVVMAITGCGETASLGEPVDVTGSVILDGQPLPNVTVGFSAITEGIPAKYRYATADTESDGSFAIPKVYPAEYMVTLNDSAADHESAKVEAVAGNPKLAKFSANSPLRAKVSDTEREFKFDVTSTPEG
jgi:hypothetical protein